MCETYEVVKLNEIVLC